MFDESLKNNIDSTQQSEGEDLKELDSTIAGMLDALGASGLDMSRWNDEYENLPNEIEQLEAFHKKISDFSERRQEALSSFEFDPSVTEEERLRMRRFDREVMSAFNNPDHFLGNGASAEVYGMPGNETICVKFITNQEQYNLNNHLRAESAFLSRVYEKTKDEKIRTPYLIFLRIHAKEGHSYGMEKIQGASLSQILEYPEKYPVVLGLAKNSNRQQLENDLLAFVDQMHDAGVVHGDLFKRNLMIGEDGKLYVIDFGKAKAIDFPGDREDERKSDKYSARQSLLDFFRQLDELTVERK